MKAVDTHLLKLLESTTQFIVPIYQRLYSWEQDECAQLWSDILRAGSDDHLGAHFTGSIVYVAKGQSTNTASEPDLIIDGQQRVTSVTLLLAALAERLGSLPDGEREPLEGFSPNKIRNRYLLRADEEGDKQFRLVLSQSDRDALKAIVRQTPVPADGASRVVENFKFFQQRLAESGTDLAAVCAGLQKLVVVDVTLTRGIDNPQLVFEAMNSTGRRLTQADLIRNYVLMDLPPGEQDKLYTSYWRPMELEFAGHADWRFDDFVRHYLTIKTGRIPRLEDIYDAFKVYSRRLSADGEPVESLVIDLHEYARRYGAMALGGEDDPALGNAFRDLEQIQANVVYPFLLEAYSDRDRGTVSSAELLAIVELVIAYVFRRAICDIPTNSLNKTFAGFAAAVRKDRYVDSVQAHLLTLPSYRRFPSDQEFRDALVSKDLYGFRRRSYFFRMLENRGRKEQVAVEEYTIEHILPQNENLSSEWQHALGEGWKEVQEKYLHTLGNLTLTGYNSEYSDHAFVRKRDMIGGFRDSPLRLNAGIGLLETWGPNEIEARAARLADEAVEIWPRPTLSADVLAEFEAPRETTGYTINDHPHLLSRERRELFERLSAATLGLDPVVTREFLKLYVAFKAETNFLDAIPQKARLLLSLGIPLDELRDERGLARDVTGKGRWGNGPTEVALDESSDFTYVISLVRQAFERQIGGA